MLCRVLKARPDYFDMVYVKLYDGQSLDDAGTIPDEILAQLDGATPNQGLAIKRDERKVGDGSPPKQGTGTN